MSSWQVGRVDTKEYQTYQCGKHLIKRCLDKEKDWKNCSVESDKVDKSQIIIKKENFNRLV